MSGSVGFPAMLERLTPRPIERSQVQESYTKFLAYLTAGTAFPGQVVAVRNETNVPDLYLVNEDLTYTMISGRGTNEDLSGLHQSVQNLSQAIQYTFGGSDADQEALKRLSESVGALRETII